MTGTFCIIDMAGFTALTEAHGDQVAAELARSFALTVRATLPPGGRLLKTMGDAVLVVVPHPDAALEFVARIWQEMPASEVPNLRAGLHHGDAVELDGDIFGAAVNLTARIAALAHADQVLASAGVAQVATSRGVTVTNLGPVAVKNVVDAVEIYSLGIAGVGSAAQVIDPVCRMRIDSARAAGHLRYQGRDYYFCSLGCTARFAERPLAYTRFQQDS